MKVCLLYTDEENGKDYRLPLERVVPPWMAATLRDEHSSGGFSVTIEMKVVRLVLDMREERAVVEVVLVSPNSDDDAFRSYLESEWFSDHLHPKIEKWWDDPAEKPPKRH